MTMRNSQEFETVNGRLVNLKLNGLPKGMKLWYGQDIGVGEDKVLDEKWNAVRLMFAEPDSFWRACWIRTEEDEWCLMEPTHFQLQMADSYQNFRWNYYNKPRQAKASTAAALLILRDTMYGDSIKSTIVAQKREVCDELMDRIIDAYERMDPIVVNPLKKGTKPTRERIEFANGNSITTITVGAKGPGVGLSRSRYLITEGCEMEAHIIRDLTGKLLPGINKRPNARLIWETTPGAFGSQMYNLWQKAWAPKPGQFSRFNGVFFKWWEDPSYVLRDQNTGELLELGPLTEEEQAFMDSHPGCTRHHVYFRRVEIQGTFDGSIDGFNNKYPPGALDGWSTTKEQVFDGAAVTYLKEMRERSAEIEEVEGASGLWEFVPPDPTAYYIYLCDPANFGSHGDYSAVSVFNVHTWEEVAAWEGFEQPTEFNKRLRKAVQHYAQFDKGGKGYTLIPENNAAALLGVIQNEGVLNLYWSHHSSGRSEPGWRASGKSLQLAEAAMDEALKQREIILRCPSGIQQLIMFDGQARDKRIKKGKNTSHFELARTYVMAAWALRDLRWPRRLTADEYRDRVAEAKALLSQAETAHQAAKRRAFNKALENRRGPSQTNEYDVWAPYSGMSR